MSLYTKKKEILSKQQKESRFWQSAKTILEVVYWLPLGLEVSFAKVKEDEIKVLRKFNNFLKNQWILRLSFLSKDNLVLFK